VLLDKDARLRNNNSSVKLSFPDGNGHRGGFHQRREHEMRNTPQNSIPLLAILTIAFIPATGLLVVAQNSEIQQRVAELKESAAANKQALAHYSWQQQQTTAIKGNVKDTKMFQVHVGPDGQQQKMEIENMPASSGGGGPLKRHIVEKKKTEYQDYGQQIAALAQEYARPDPERIQQAYQQGNLTLGPSGIPGEVKILISNYIKPNDKVTIIFNRQTKAIQSLQVATYLDDPADAVTIGAQFSKLPDGTNHVSTMQLNGVKKDLLVTVENSNYQKAM
jgi:hypothetical protein